MKNVSVFSKKLGKKVTVKTTGSNQSVMGWSNGGWSKSGGWKKPTV